MARTVTQLKGGRHWGRKEFKRNFPTWAIYFAIQLKNVYRLMYSRHIDPPQRLTVNPEINHGRCEVSNFDGSSETQANCWLSTSSVYWLNMEITYIKQLLLRTVKRQIESLRFWGSVDATDLKTPFNNKRSEQMS